MAANIKLSSKLIGGFVVVAIITVIVGIVGLWGLSKLMAGTKDIADIRMPSVQNLLTIDRNFEAFRVAQRTLLATDLTPKDRQRLPRR